MTACKLLPLAALTLGLLPGFAQQQPFTGTPEIEQSLDRLNQLGSVLMIAAHPDDERTGVLAYFARGRHMRTAYLSVTRGEGGQNLIGSEQGPELGVIRTQELLAARKIDGAEQFFTRAIDFGFTKTASETLQKWGHDSILSDIVWVIRRYRPDVIVLVFSGTPSDGHGQHQVASILGKEAFTAAADPAKFPEQLRYAAPWQAVRLVRAGGFGGPPGGRGGQPAAGGAGTAPPTGGRGGGRGARGGTGGGNTSGAAPLTPAGEVDTGAYNPILGYSYEELATLSRSMHHSQGTGAMRRPGGNPSAFSLVAGTAAPSPKDLFDGIDTTWNRLPGGGAIGPILERAIREFEPAHPEKAIPALAQARPLIAAIADPLARIKLAELDETMARCAGIWAEAQARGAEVAPGSTLEVTTTVMNRSPEQVALTGAQVEGIWNEPLEVKPASLGVNRSATVEFSRVVPAGQPYSQPYWLAKPATGDVYTVDDQELVGLADTPAVVRVRLKLTIGGAAIEIVRPVHYRYGDRAKGERTRPLVVVPVVAVNLPARVAVFPNAAARTLHVLVGANVADAAGDLRLDVPAGWKAEPPKQDFRIASVGEQRELVFTVTPPAGETTATLRAVATVGGREISSGLETIAYSHIPPQTLFPDAAVKLVRADIRVTARKVGYIMGAGDEMPEALRQLGIEVTPLDQTELAQGDLARFDAIVAGVRAYNVRADVRANQARLLEYARNGGTYVVQYQTGDGSLNVGPYPMTIPAGSRYRVTVEEAPVEFPHPASPLLREPNRIEAAKDFEGWIQERGLYFASQWDPRYETVLSSHDPGEDALEGGELWTRYGKGVYIFTSYAWFRQLPGGVPGAFRLFANLLSAK
jgi:LmbE family N-acetylglucosaminyl deacetylase